MAVVQGLKCEFVYACVHTCVCISATSDLFRVACEILYMNYTHVYDKKTTMLLARVQIACTHIRSDFKHVRYGKHIRPLISVSVYIYIYIHIYMEPYMLPPSRTHALCLNCLGSSSCPYKSLQSPLFLVICEVH